MYNSSNIFDILLAISYNLRPFDISKYSEAEITFTSIYYKTLSLFRYNETA